MPVLLSLSVKNFKSIRAGKVRFGPLTCLVGHNGSGKSNLFDAIHFLSALADRDVAEAAMEVRKSSDGSHSPLDLVFGRDPNLQIELTAEMIVPMSVLDDFGQVARPSTTMLSYELVLGYDEPSDRLLVRREQLTHSRLGEFGRSVGFPFSTPFRNSVAQGSRRGGPLISTSEDKGAIMLHGDGGSRGRPAPVGTSPLTVVGGTNTFDYPTVLAAKREMESWRVLQLEPSSMRAPDHRSADPHVTSSGAHLAATLRQLTSGQPDVRLEVVNRLRALNSDVIDLDVYEDTMRDQLALRAKLSGVDSWLFGRSLSDGTLRYIALTLMLTDVRESGLLCLEEPENGIHPSRVPDLVSLLYDYAVDPEEATGDTNPARQVLINTHSPEVARQLVPDDLVFVERAKSSDGAWVSVFRPVVGTWRTKLGTSDELVSAPKDRQAVADFIGGSPIRDGEQMSFEFGTAT